MNTDIMQSKVHVRIDKFNSLTTNVQQAIVNISALRHTAAIQASCLTDRDGAILRVPGTATAGQKRTVASTR